MFDQLAGAPLERRWREQMHPLPVVVSIIRRSSDDDTSEESGDSYLLIRRNSEPYSNRWALVGGKWDFGETLPSAATREVKEETGLDASFVALRGVVNERLKPDTPEEGGAAHFLIFVCQLDAHLGEASEQSEGAVAWFTGVEIEALQSEGSIIPSDYAMLKNFSEASAVPHFEVDMLNSGVGTTGSMAPRLARFEKIG